MLFSNKEVVRFSDVYLEVHIVGYPEMGESIVLLLKDSGKVILTLVTDSYYTEQANEVERILQMNGKPPVDIFVWTHPDEDHSVGIEHLLDTYDNNGYAKIYMPSNLSRDIIKCQVAQDAYRYLMSKYNSGRRYMITSIGVDKDLTLPFWKFQFRERQSNRKISGSLTFLLPESALTQRRAFEGAENAGDMNDFSIVYILELNGIRYFFGGDMAGQSVQFLMRHKTYLENIRYIKIPHHGSKEPLKLVDMLSPFQMKKAVSTTTIFKDSHPYDVTLDRYGNICAHVSSTHRGVLPYGRVLYNFSMSKMEVPVPVYEGNARQVRP